MSGIANAPRPTLRQSLQPEDTLFLSPHKSLLARGRIASLTEPAEYGHLANGTFQLRLQALFHQAQHAGVENPIVIGAIPFDKSQPSALFAPAEYHWLDRTAIAATPVPEAVVQGACRFQPDHDDFCQMVSAALRQLTRDELQKVVLSRLLHIDLPQPQHALRLWQQLNRQNPDSYNFHLPLTDGVLIGASPELLLRKRGEEIDSMPLAGSAQRSADAAQDARLRAALLASRKDRHEHQIVADAIRRRLAERCQYLMLPEPEPINTPALWHLATRVQGRVLHPQENALSLACLLHPTPALCGAPWQRAHALIQQLEPFKRGWFGGIVGWCDAQGNGEWVVTIRCGYIQPRRITLFAGAGIVPDSQPENEWHETGVKLSTMLRALGCTQLQEAS
ncbi:isochorismate synthase [Mixta intestinalis]|uniref:isochorismate synthase n=1 Tax=Mixta intestinalis TaxID=1615494 RepID=A0A6P1Q0X2_9GAMM|nr:isochorismate synthase [Mixta intestinalis]QHM71777.1 Isochorismate synthase EntC [Mixta intestinalis]